MKTTPRIVVGLAVLFMAASLSAQQNAWLQQALERSGQNRVEIEKALAEAPETMKGTMTFVAENMPARDLRSVTATYLLKHVRLAHEAESVVPWGASIPTGSVRLLVVVRDWNGSRTDVPVRVVRVGSEIEFKGVSRGETADTNDICSFDLPKDGSWRIHAGEGAGSAVRTFRAGEAAEETVELKLSATPGDLSRANTRRAESWFRRAFLAISAGRELAKEPASLKETLLNPRGEAAIRQIAWRVYGESKLAMNLRGDYEARQVRHEKWKSAYTVKDVGRRPKNGWPLVIALHGGGGAPKSVNDSQWRHMQIYYKDHPEAGGYRYVALRAPNDTWNGFYDNYVYPLIARLIRQFLIFGDVDANRVHVIGYSHGGYGTFSIAPKIPHRFAAAHASASAPTDGQTSARSLRNLPFSFMVGGRDTAHGRAERCQKFAKIMAKLGEGNRAGWPSAFQWKPRYPHGGLPDRDHLPRLLLHRRDPVPRDLDWELTDTEVRSHYWLQTVSPGNKRSIRANLYENHLSIEPDAVGGVTALLDGRLVDLAKPLLISHGEKKILHRLRPRLGVLARSLHDRGDPYLAGTIRVSLVGP